MTPLFRKFLSLNWLIMLTLMGLVIFGIFSIYSASWMRTSPDVVNAYKKQIQWALFGLVVLVGISFVDYRWVRWLALPTYLTGIGCLALLRIIGTHKSGAASWLKLGPLPQFQPSQLAILGTIMLLAVVLGELQWLHPVFRNHLLRLGLVLLVTAVPAALIAAEPDMGTATSLAPIAVAMLLVANIPFRYLTVLTLLSLIAAPLIYWFALQPYQRERIDTLLRANRGEQLDQRGVDRDFINAITAIGSGGWEGKGHKGARIKRENPEAKTFNEIGIVSAATSINDFIFAAIGEEHGFRGSLILVSALGLLLLQCLYVAFCSRDPLGRLLVVGAVSLLFFHIFWNIGMTVQLVPITGLPLPFISYGGTFLLVCCLHMGLVESVWVHRNVDVPDEKALYA